MYLIFALFVILFLITVVLELKNISLKNQLMFGWAMLSIIAIFCGFRFEFGGDWKVYLDAFNSVKAGGGDYPYEPIFRLIVKFLTQFQNGYLLLNIITTVLFLGFCSAAICKIDDLRGKLIHFLYFIFPIGIVLMNLGFIRQAIACSICLLAYTYFLKKKYTKTLLSLIIAQGFHVSAFLFAFYLLFSFWLELKNKKIKNYILFATVALSAISLLLLFTIRKEYIGGYKSDGLLPRILYLILLSSMLIYLKNLKNLFQTFKFSLIMSAILVIGYLICKKLMITSVLDRAMYYLILPICLDILLELVKNDKKTNLQLIIFHFSYSMIFLIGWFALSPYSKYWRHYQFWIF